MRFIYLIGKGYAGQNDEIRSSQLGSSLQVGTRGILVGTANSFWGKKHFCSRYLKHTYYLALSKNGGGKYGG